MTRLVGLTRRGALAALGAVALSAATRRPAYAAEAEAAVPFAPGDVAVGCTLLNDPDDDHRGLGRILHYDPALRLKRTITLDDTTHIVQGTRFGPDGTLWAFDAFAYRIVRFDRQGRRLPNFQAPPRSFAHVTFAPDGSFYLGENFVGTASRVRLRTTIPYMPGTRRFGDGHLFHFAKNGRLIREYATAVHGGMGGFQGLTSSALSADGKVLHYTSESGPRLMRYDLAADRQLPDLLAFPENTGQFFFDVAFDRRGRLLAVRGLTVDALDASDGAVLQSYPVTPFGWASLSIPVTDTHVYASNFFTGDLVKISLADGRVLAKTNVGVRKSLSGAAEMPAT
jgi:outer membrane protein assembly factor BamB